ncbi:MAG: Gfo/Idh/MocA family protein [Isosphaeraceae bacterium]
MVEGHRILVSGVGSVGERHIRNLIHLGHDQISLHRTRNLPFRTLDREFPTYSDLTEALQRFKPTVVFVTGPTASHMPVALAAARAGCHLFIEKPISHTLDGVTELAETLDQRGRHAMVGYMLRFHPLLRRVKTWLEQGESGPLGLPLFVRSSWGEHVPDWHPWEDYRDSYAVLPGMGGGPALTLSHDLDLVVWMLGRPDLVVGLANRSSPLEAACEHAVDVLLRFPGGATANVHLDYLQRPPQRSWELVGTRGRVVFDYHAGTLTRYQGTVGEAPPPGGVVNPEAESWSLPAGFERNDLFLDELRDFFVCLAENRPPSPGISEAAMSVQIALAVMERN